MFSQLAVVSKEVKIFANPTGCAHGTGPTRSCRSQTAYHGHVAGRRRAGDARYALWLTIFPLPDRFDVVVGLFPYSFETILRSMTGFKGEKVQNPSDDHTIEEARVARIAKSQQRTCPRRTRASRGTVAARQTTFVRKPPLSVMLDSAEHHLTSMAAAKRLNPIVTWPPSAKGHHDPWSAQVKKSSLTARGRQN